MFIEFELKGENCVHKGVFDTTGFWAKYEPQIEQGMISEKRGLEWIADGYKIFSHFSFAFYHSNEHVAKEVYKGLLGALAGIDWVHPEIGFIREVC